jgi:hypothetical protein
LTNYDTTVACSIEEGSVLEVAGSLYIATSDTAIGTAGISTALQYIQAIGSTGGCVFAYNAVAPTWRDDYQGYYASAASTTRVIGGINYTGSYTEKWVYRKPKDMVYLRASGSLRPWQEKSFNIGDWNMFATTVCSFVHGLDLTKIKTVAAFIRADDSAIHALYSIDFMESGHVLVSSTQFVIEHYAASIFDNTSFDQTSFNRGWIFIKYEDGT